MRQLEWLIGQANLRIDEYGLTRPEILSVYSRTLPCYVMSYMHEGVSEARLGGKSYLCEPGNLLLLPPRIPHDHVSVGEGRHVYLWWHFNLDIGDQIDLMRLMEPPVIIKVHNSIAFETVFTQCLDLFRQTQSIPNIILKRAKCLEVMAYLFESIIESCGSSLTKMDSNPLPDAFFSILRDIVEKPDRDIDLNALAEQYHMNKTYISNRFKQLFSISPVKLRNNLLHSKARSLLMVEGRSVGEIAGMLGFDDLSAFTRFFTNHEGVSPMEFRSRLPQNNPSGMSLRVAEMLADGD